jgi:hypothetical protein
MASIKFLPLSKDEIAVLQNLGKVNRTISQLEAEDYPWIGCECCRATVWVPFKMLRERNTNAQCHDARSARSEDALR